MKQLVSDIGKQDRLVIVDKMKRQEINSKIHLGFLPRGTLYIVVQGTRSQTAASCLAEETEFMFGASGIAGICGVGYGRKGSPESLAKY